MNNQSTLQENNMQTNYPYNINKYKPDKFLLALLTNVCFSLGTTLSSKCSIAIEEMSRSSWSISCALGGVVQDLT